MRLLAGAVAPCAFETVLEGDESLSSRPMERVAEPLREMGAEVRTNDGRPPLAVRGGPLTGIEHRTAVPSAQVKSSVLLAGLAAQGETTVLEPAPTRDHTERALAHLGAPIEAEPGRATVRAFQHGGLVGWVPGDVSSAAFLVAAALIAGVKLEVEDVGVNPTRTAFLRVLQRMGAITVTELVREELGEPVGMLTLQPGASLTGTVIDADELPMVIDEVPALAAVAAHAIGETRFDGAGELKVKESDRLGSLEASIRVLGGQAAIEGEALVVAGGGLRGGELPATRDHRIAMASTVAALGATGPVTIDGIEAADVSFPGFIAALRKLGATIEG
jgi:3-phosphoshikimate 1-carboxyvinyltransferase